MCCQSQDTGPAARPGVGRVGVPVVVGSGMLFLEKIISTVICWHLL